MSELDIEEIFNTIIDYGCTVRKFVLLTKPKENIGLNAWRMVKESFADFKFKTKSGEILSKIKVNKILIEKINKLIETQKYNYDESDKDQDKVKLELNSVKLDNQVEIDHFFIQHYRLLVTSNFELSALKLMQVAYNIGQLKAQNKFNKYDDKLMEYYKSNNLNNISTFVDIDDVKLVKDTAQTGGFKLNTLKLFYKFKKIDF
jgi:hypothetical protein